MVYKLVICFCPYQDGGKLVDFSYNNEEGITNVRLYDWNDDRKTRNISVSWRPYYSVRLVTLKLGRFKSDFLLSCQEKLYGFSKDRYGSVGNVTFYDLPMHEYIDYETVFLEIEVIRLWTAPFKVPESLKESPKENSIQPSVQPITITRPEPLGVCVKKLFGTGEFSDVTLSDGTTDVKAHKLILSLNSPVFAKMFQNPMKENQENRVLIEDISMDVLNTLLNFMYSEAIEVSDRTMVRELYIASEKYDVRSLREICSDLLKSVDITNVIDTLLLADLHSDEILKQAALDFVTKHFSEMKAMEEWKNLMKENQALYLEALSYVVDKKL